MLGIREKLALQKTVKEGITRLKAGVENIRERISLQKEIKESLDRLKGATTATKETLLDRFLAGEFTKAKPEVMWKNFCKAYAEAKEDLSILKGALIKFFEWHEKNPGQVFENAGSKTFDLGAGDDVLRGIMALISSGAKGSITINLG